MGVRGLLKEAEKKKKALCRRPRPLVKDAQGDVLRDVGRVTLMVVDYPLLANHRSGAWAARIDPETLLPK